MFPDSAIAQSYQQVESMVKYNIHFGIAPYVKEMLITFKTDEATTSQHST